MMRRVAEEDLTRCPASMTGRQEIGLVAVSYARTGRSLDLDAALRAAEVVGRTEVTAGGIAMATWGRIPDGAPAMLLTKETRRREQQVDAVAIRRMLVDRDEPGLAEMMPSFGAATSHGDALTIATDALGFRHVYYRCGHGWAAVSTSARVLAALAPTTIDHEGAAVQSLLGWQLRDRTLFDGVTKLPAGMMATIRRGELALVPFVQETSRETCELGVAVDAMTTMLRTYLGAYLDDHPDAVLQLTGGQDSRLLLSAVEPSRRKGLNVLTLGPATAPDVVIAAYLAKRYGMQHEVLDLAEVARLGGEEAYERCVLAAKALEFGADPIARAALDVAEEHAPPGPRISGLGGEVARGFYYLGRGTSVPVTSQRAKRLTDWRMFANESVEPDVLSSEFRTWARDFANREVLSVLEETRLSWLSATDDLYLRQRMQRWAGVTETAVSSVRQVVNPMLDDRWIATTTALSPRDKRHSLFLARLQVSLDEELARVALDGRPAPIAYAQPGPRTATQQHLATGRAAGRKLLQRVSGRRRPPAGGYDLASQVIQHWRQHPDLIGSLANSEIIDRQWIDDLLMGRREATPSTVAFVTNLSLAAARTSAE